MKRYFCFMGSNYYPSRGMGDFIKDVDTEEEALEWAEQVLKDAVESGDIVWSWVLVWDSQTRTYLDSVDKLEENY